MEKMGGKAAGAMSGWTVEEWLHALGHRKPTPAGGALALMTLAGAAALAAKIARLAGRDPAAFDAWTGTFFAGAEGDGEAYRAAVREGAEGVGRCLGLGVDQATEAVGFLEALGPLFPALSPGLRADVAAAERLGRAAAQTLLVNLAVNLQAWAGRADGLDSVAASLEALRARLEAA